eukprot:tig00020902_g15000.t1
MMYLSDFMSGADSEIVGLRDEFLAIGRFIKEKGLGASLASDLVSFFDFRAQNQSSDQGIFKELPRNLQVQVSRQVSRPLIASNRTFADCDDNFVDSLSVLLQEQTLLPKTQVFRRGDLSHTLYFVASGVVRPPTPPLPWGELAKHNPTQEELIFKRVLGACGDEDGRRSVASGTSEALGSMASGDGRRSVHEIVRQAKEKREQEKTVAMLTEAHKGNLEGVKRYLAMDVDVDSADYDGRTALHLAASDGHIDIIHLLIDRGANLNAKDRYGGTPVIDAVRHKQDEAAALLIRFGASACFEDVATMLCTAAADGDIDALRRLVECGVDPGTPDYDGRTALHLAACNGNQAAVEYLIQQGVDLSPLDRNKGTPLQDAVRHGYHHIAELLLRSGAEMKVENASGMLCNAAARGDVETLKVLLRYGLPINDGDYDGRTPLHLAAAEGKLQCLEYLLQNGADVAAVDRWNGNALHDAVRHGHKLAAQVLIDWGCELETGRLRRDEAHKLEAQLESLLNSRSRGPRHSAAFSSASHAHGHGLAPEPPPGTHRRPSLGTMASAWSDVGSRRASLGEVRLSGVHGSDHRSSRGGGSAAFHSSVAHGLRAVAEDGGYDPAIVRAQEEFEKSVADLTGFLEKEVERLQQQRRRALTNEAKLTRAVTQRSASLAASSDQLAAIARTEAGVLVLGEDASRPPSDPGTGTGSSSKPQGRPPSRQRASPTPEAEEAEEGGEGGEEEEGGTTLRSEHSLTGFEGVLSGERPGSLRTCSTASEVPVPSDSSASMKAAEKELKELPPLFEHRAVPVPVKLNVTPPSRTDIAGVAAMCQLPPAAAPPPLACAPGPEPVVLTEFDSGGDLVFEFGAADPGSSRTL